MYKSSPRHAFTLVEILIVLGIIVLVAAIFVPIVLNLTERNQVSKAASMLENALNIAKSRAVAQKRPSGIRLVAAANNLRSIVSGPAFAWYDQIQYVEDIGDYNTHWVWGLASINTPVTLVQPWWSRNPTQAGDIPVPTLFDAPVGFDTVTVSPGPFTFTALIDTAGTVVNRVGIPRNRLLFGPISMLLPAANQWTANSGTVYRSQRFEFSYIDNQNAVITNNVASLSGNVLPGDKIELIGVGQIYTVVSVSAALAAGPRVTASNVNIAASGNPITVPVLELDRDLTTDVVPSLNGRPNYRIIRQPRVIANLAPMKLPQDVVIDLTPTRVGFFGTPPVIGPGPLNGRAFNADIDSNANFFMTGVSTGIQIPLITGINQTTLPNRIAPLYIDILFSPTGEIMPTSQEFGNQTGGLFSNFNIGSSGLIALWLHQRGDPNLWFARQATAAQGNADNQAIVSINSRTGFIGSFPVSVTEPIGLNVDPLFNARLGKARISADTGQ
ncbi:MAG TPA: prepilin-type N-terminal cleavage/methylation domain-containing protein [Gemmatales bacterium]|nr:prepilin-type N-terminal cleavage/methylation domain-containing protein [Gemmatales bacterium]